MRRTKVCSIVLKIRNILIVIVWQERQRLAIVVDKFTYLILPIGLIHSRASRVFL